MKNDSRFPGFSVPEKPKGELVFRSRKKSIKKSLKIFYF